jgi:hypothetical protein
VVRTIADSAKPIGQRVADDELDAIRSGRDAIGVDTDATPRLLPRPEDRPFERDPRGSPLRESASTDFESLSRFDLTGSHLDDVDERWRQLAFTPQRTEKAGDDAGQDQDLT